MDVAAGVLGDLERGVVAVGAHVVDVLKLLGHIDVRVFGGHAVGDFYALVDGLADVALVVDDNHLGAVMVHQLATLQTH